MIKNYFKQYERYFLIILLVVTSITMILGIYFFLLGASISFRLIATSGLIATVSGVVQLEVSGLFERITEKYGDEKKYPFGPPSFITKEIIGNSDISFFIWIRDVVFFRSSTGFWLIVLGTFTQVFSVWITVS